MPLSILLYQGIRELVKRRMRSFKTIRTLKRNCKDVGHENCGGDTDPCRIIGKCDKELGYKWLENLNIRISISLLKKLCR